MKQSLYGRIYKGFDENHYWLVTVDYDGYYLDLVTHVSMPKKGHSTYTTDRVDGGIGTLERTLEIIEEFNKKKSLL